MSRSARTCPATTRSPSRTRRSLTASRHCGTSGRSTFGSSRSCSSCRRAAGRAGRLPHGVRRSGLPADARHLWWSRSADRHAGHSTATACRRSSPCTSSGAPRRWTAEEIAAAMQLPTRGEAALRICAADAQPLAPRPRARGHACDPARRSRWRRATASTASSPATSSHEGRGRDRPRSRASADGARLRRGCRAGRCRRDRVRRLRDGRLRRHGGHPRLRLPRRSVRRPLPREVGDRRRPRAIAGAAGRGRSGRPVRRRHRRRAVAGADGGDRATRARRSRPRAPRRRRVAGDGDPRRGGAGLRTIPPREIGGNLDIRQLVAGARITLPVARRRSAGLGRRPPLRPGRRRGLRHRHRGGRRRHAPLHVQEGAERASAADLRDACPARPTALSQRLASRSTRRWTSTRQRASRCSR